MERNKRPGLMLCLGVLTALLSAVLALCLLAAGCGTARADAGDPEAAVPVTVLDYAAFPDLGGVETVSVSAGFLTEDGEPLSEGTVRLRVGETGADFPLDGAGELRVSGLPRQGTVELTLLDGGVPILGVVQKKADTPLALAIRSHPRVRLIEVSEENRDTLLPTILEALRS